jgi:predicted house-cleaning noncanonical NTP pyrophosphatase (MazG superfamily)
VIERWITGAFPAPNIRFDQCTDEKEHQLLLVQKLIEETMEVVFSEDRDELLKELADLLSVMEGCARANGIGWFEVLDKQAERDAASGPFIDGMVWETDR